MTVSVSSPKAPATEWLLPALSLVSLAVLTAAVWAHLFPPNEAPFFFDIESYRDTLDGVVAGDLMYDWLGYPPVTLIILSPLRGLPTLAGERLWTGMAMALGLVMAAALAKLSLRTPGGRLGFVTRFGIAGSLLMISFPMINQLETGQITIIIVALAFLDASGALPRRYQGALVGLAASFKLLPLIFFPYYLITKQWRQLAIACAAFGTSVLIGFLLFPRDSMYFWTHINSSDRLGPARLDNLSVFGLLNRWLVDPTVATWVWLPLAGVIGLAAYYRAWRHYGRGEQVQAALVLGCASTAISPIAWPHYQLWLALAAIWMVLANSPRTKALGLATYMAYSVLFVFTAYAVHGMGLLASVVWELTVLVPVAISVLGLPRDLPQRELNAEAALN